MNLLEKIMNTPFDELDSIISIELKEKIEKSQKVEMLGFAGFKLVPYHKGFIHSETRIKYQKNNLATYSMETTDYFYEFARELKKRQVINRGELVRFIYTFLNQYFGIPKDNLDYRDSIFLDIAFQTTTTDDELFDRLEQNKIGDLKQKKRCYVH